MEKTVIGATAADATVHETIAPDGVVRTEAIEEKTDDTPLETKGANQKRDEEMEKLRKKNQEGDQNQNHLIEALKMTIDPRL